MLWGNAFAGIGDGDRGPSIWSIGGGDGDGAPGGSVAQSVVEQVSEDLSDPVRVDGDGGCIGVVTDQCDVRGSVAIGVAADCGVDEARVSVCTGLFASLPSCARETAVMSSASRASRAVLDRRIAKV